MQGASAAFSSPLRLQSSVSQVHCWDLSKNLVTRHTRSPAFTTPSQLQSPCKPDLTVIPPSTGSPTHTSRPSGLPKLMRAGSRRIGYVPPAPAGTGNSSLATLPAGRLGTGTAGRFTRSAVTSPGGSCFTHDTVAPAAVAL